MNGRKKDRENKLMRQNDDVALAVKLCPREEVSPIQGEAATFEGEKLEAGAAFGRQID